MRLTLRTLLAYLDGLLPEEHRAELEAKVNSSTVVPQLVARIRNVASRPGLAAPRTDGRGLAEDPNTVAEFLDNALPAERLEAFERICIDSDIHLAETADCHAALAELAAGAAEIAPLDQDAARRVLMHVVSHLGEPTPDTDHAESLAMARQVRKAMSEPPRRQAAGKKPAPRASLAAWFSAAVAVVLVVALAGLLVRSLWKSTRPPQEVAVAEPVAPEGPAGNDAEPTAEADGAAEPAAAPSDRTAEASLPAAEPPSAIPAPAAAVVDNQPPPADRGEPAQPGEPSEPSEPALPGEPAVTAVADAPAVRLPMMEAAIEGPIEPDPPAAEPPPEAEPPAAAMVAEGGLLLHRVIDDAGSRWKRLPPGEPLAPTEQFVVPAACYPVIAEGSLTITLLPGTLGSLRHDPDGTPRVEIAFGKGIVWSEAAEQRVGVIAGGLVGVASLGPRQPLGISVELLRAPGGDPLVAPPGQQAVVFAGGGTRWQQTDFEGQPAAAVLTGIDREQPLPRGTAIQWLSSDPAAARLLPAGRQPAWMQDASAGGRGRLWAARAAERMARQLAAEGSTEEVLGQMAASRRPEDRLAAATTLALLGDYDELVRLLCEERPGQKLLESQWETLEHAVQLALARGENASARLLQSFRTQGLAGRGEELFRLALGVDPNGFPAAAAAALVASLEDPALVIRRYAFKNLKAAFPDQTEAAWAYAPDRSRLLNVDAVSRWRRAVESVTAEATP